MLDSLSFLNCTDLVQMSSKAQAIVNVQQRVKVFARIVEMERNLVNLPKDKARASDNLKRSAPARSKSKTKKYIPPVVVDSIQWSLVPDMARALVNL